jgi:hypothetical protein
LSFPVDECIILNKNNLFGVERNHMHTKEKPGNSNQARSRWPRILFIIAVFFIVVAILSAWWIKHNLYASPFNLTKLNEQEQQVLDTKLDRLERSIQKDKRSLRAGPAETMRKGRLVPERYTEDAARRHIRITEKELNALVPKDEETARRVAIVAAALPL